MDAVVKSGQWQTSIGGIPFVSRRKSVAVMVKAKGFLAVAGQLAAADNPDAEVTDSQASAIVSFTEAVMRAAVISPVIAPPGEPTIEGVQYAYEDLQAHADLWIPLFLESGLSVDPTGPSCEA